MRYLVETRKRETIFFEEEIGRTTYQVVPLDMLLGMVADYNNVPISMVDDTMIFNKMPYEEEVKLVHTILKDGVEVEFGDSLKELPPRTRKKHIGTGYSPDGYRKVSHYVDEEVEVPPQKIKSIKVGNFYAEFNMDIKDEASSFKKYIEIINMLNIAKEDVAKNAKTPFGGGVRTGAASGIVNYWVIKPDGSMRDPDMGSFYEKYWYDIGEGDLALSHRKSSQHSKHIFEIEKAPENLTKEQKEAVNVIQEKIADFWEGRVTGNDHLSPSMERGWDLTEPTYKIVSEPHRYLNNK